MMQIKNHFLALFAASIYQAAAPDDAKTYIQSAQIKSKIFCYCSRQQIILARYRKPSFPFSKSGNPEGIEFE